MTILYLIFSILFIFGFHLVGERISKLANFTSIIEEISDPIYQYSLIGIGFFIFFLYPLLFLGFYNKNFFFILSISILLLGVVFIIFNFLNLFHFIMKFNIISNDNKFLRYLFFLIVLLYLFISISPITSGDSLAYHLTASKFILNNGKFPTGFYDSTNSLVGAGEFFNAFPLSINAFQATSLINFVGIISVIGIIKKCCENFNLSDDLKYINYLCILSCPVLIFLVSSSKSQLFSTSLIFFSYSLFFYSLKKNNFNSNTIKKFIIITILCVVAVQTKISFSLSFFLIIMSIFIYFRKDHKKFHLIIIFSLLFCFGLLPYTFWKQSVYDYHFYYFFFNPFPLNIPGYFEAYNSAKIHSSSNFPLSLIIPLSLSNLAQFIGIGIFSLFFLIKNKFNNKKTFFVIFFAFIIIYTIFGQKAPRFYLEIYLLTILFFSQITKKIYNKKSFKFFKMLILLQSFYVTTILFVGCLSLFPGVLTENLKNKVLSKHASGYNLYTWVNSVLPENSKFITTHRSTYFSKNDPIFFEIVHHINKNDNKTKIYHLEKIKEEKPNFILFYGEQNNYNFKSLNFHKCTNGLFSAKRNAGFHETRNIFNSSKNYYNAYLFHFDYTKLPGCVSLN